MKRFFASRYGVMIFILFAILAINVSTPFANPSDFEIKSVTGETKFKLTKAEGKYVALHFLLKTECPLCRRYVVEYMKNLEKKKEKDDVVHLFIKPDSQEEIKKWASKIPRDITVPYFYHDKDAELAKAFDIKFGYKFHGEVVHYPAFILLDKKGKEIFRYVGKDTTDRFEYKDYLKKIKEVKSKEKSKK